MPGFNSFAVAGVGGIGTFIAASLVARGASVIGLTRRGSDRTLPHGVVRREVDYDDEAQLARVLSDAKVECLVSALSGGGVQAQPALARAAKEAGVKFFVPSEYGIPATASRDGPFPTKAYFRDYLEELGLPYTLVHTGMFTDQIFTPLLGIDIKNARATIIGPGTEPITFTARKDIGAYLAYVLTTENVPNELRIEGARITLREAITAIERVKGISIAIRIKDPEEIRRKPDPKSFADLLGLLWADGKSAVGNNTNSLWPDFAPLSVPDVIALYY